jgi:hypothetical protein
MKKLTFGIFLSIFLGLVKGENTSHEILFKIPAH